MCADIFSHEQRSILMGKIRSRNTKPELVVRALCHSMGLRYRLHRKDLPGCPDLVFPKYHLCLFVHGCFWHRHTGCKFAYTPKSNLDFWLPKLQRTVERDRETSKALIEMGWHVAVIWECETKHASLLETKITAIFQGFTS